MGTPLKNWNINIYRGILTGYNEAFIIDGKKKDELIEKDPKSADIIRPFNCTKNLNSYYNVWRERIIIQEDIANR
ncbi:hypothetical protein EZS27_037042 [termite gut metagenome]|uniref:Uncharacterized protein n=1 Tax=termite gut metagenome TaxID=433724 RepID=A0A5J4PSZ1_9ZZZZ